MHSISYPQPTPLSPPQSCGDEGLLRFSLLLLYFSFCSLGGEITVVFRNASRGLCNLPKIDSTKENRIRKGHITFHSSAENFLKNH